MTEEMRKKALIKLGATDGDIGRLLEYTKNVFSKIPNTNREEPMPKWSFLWDSVLEVCDKQPRLEMFDSAAGTIPIIYPLSTADYENILRKIVYRGKEIAHIENMGASFVHGKTVRFIILTNKPYSGVAAADMGLSEDDWLEKSICIRKHHECAHYYTKQFLGLARNHLHDELIADYCGIYAAFGEYRAEWFMNFITARLGIYTKSLSAAETNVIIALAAAAAEGVEAWTRTDGFAALNEAGRIEFLAGRELLEYVL